MEHPHRAAPPSEVSPRAHRGLGLALIALAGACDGCPGNKPFTPYTLDGSTSATPPAPTAVDVSDAGAGADADAGPRFTIVPSVKAPGDGRDWALPGGKIVPAPAGRAWQQGLVADLEGDG